VLSQAVGELADRGRLARAVDADDEDDARPTVHAEPARLAEERGDLFDERFVEIADLAPCLEPADELGGRGDADIGRDQRFFEPLPGRLVGRIERGRGDLFRERSPALAERVA
jgi:hypothetical protein